MTLISGLDLDNVKMNQVFTCRLNVVSFVHRHTRTHTHSLARLHYLSAKVVGNSSRDFDSRGVTAATLFTPTLFRQGMIIHGATYFEDVGQRSPVQDADIIVHL